jgi:NADH-quinone oxidoreductase subunit J
MANSNQDLFFHILFYASALLTILSAIMVASSSNIIHSCIYLLGSLIGVAGLYLTLGADFVAAVQIMVYVGGVVVLMLFAIMMTGGREFMKTVTLGLNRAPFMGNKKTYIWGGVVALIAIFSIKEIIVMIPKFKKLETLAPYKTTIKDIGNSLLTDHVLAFEFSSVLLLGALVGAAIIARPKESEAQDSEDKVENNGQGEI